MSPEFPHALPDIRLTVDTVIATVEDGQLKVLLIQRTGEPFAGRPALPGGYLQADEVSEESARRVLADKAGVQGVYLEQLYTFDAPDRDPRGRVVSVAYFALVPRDRLRIEPGPATQHPSLVPIAELPELAFDHAEIIRYAQGRIQSKLEYTNVVYSLLPASFTLSQLQGTYEAILCRPLDKRNFQKKFLSLDLIETTGEKTSGGQHRPAQLYRFKDTSPAELKKFF